MSNISDELVASLHAFVRRRPELELLSDARLASVTESVSATFVADRSSLWWWESLRNPATVEEYGDEDGQIILQHLLGCVPGPLTLVVTNDELPPWEGVKGSLEPLLDLIRDHHHFEYFFVDDFLSWIVFDTHHNCLVIAGDLGGQDSSD